MSHHALSRLVVGVLTVIEVHSYGSVQGQGTYRRKSLKLTINKCNFVTINVVKMLIILISNYPTEVSIESTELNSITIN